MFCQYIVCLIVAIGDSDTSVIFQFFLKKMVKHEWDSLKWNPSCMSCVYFRDNDENQLKLFFKTNNKINENIQISKGNKKIECQNKVYHII